MCTYIPHPSEGLLVFDLQPAGVARRVARLPAAGSRRTGGSRRAVRACRGTPGSGRGLEGLSIPPSPTETNLRRHEVLAFDIPIVTCSRLRAKQYN